MKNDFRSKQASMEESSPLKNYVLREMENLFHLDHSMMLLVMLFMHNRLVNSLYHSNSELWKIKFCVQRLSEMCNKRRKCTIIVDASTFQEDPCPSTSKYLQMSYRCTPG